MQIKIHGMPVCGADGADRQTVWVAYIKQSTEVNPGQKYFPELIGFHL